VLDLGHTRVAMLAGVTRGNDRAQSRVDGVRDALEAHCLSLDAERLTEVPYSLEAGADAARKLLDTANKPTAIICGNDVLAAGAMLAIRDLGLSVPRDVSVIGFDDIELAKLLDPPLTTVHIPHRRMGQSAAQLLLLLREGQEDAESIVIPTELVERQSLGPAASS
jgi:LacI family transcriptional regulator